MAGLHIRWRRDRDGLPAPALQAAIASGEEARRFCLGAGSAHRPAGAGRAPLQRQLGREHPPPPGRAPPHASSPTTSSCPSDPVEYFDTDESPLNPYNRDGGGSFVYGTLPLFLTKVVGRRRWAGQLRPRSCWSAGTSRPSSTPPRCCCVFLIARRLYGATAGLLARCLLCDGAAGDPARALLRRRPVPDLLHHGRPVLLACAIAQEGRRVDYALAGLMLGLAWPAS